MKGERRLRVLWISHLVPYPPKGGVLIRSYNLVRELSKYHEVDLFAFNQERLLSAYFKTLEQGINESRTHLLGFINTLHIEDIPSDHPPCKKTLLALASLFRAHPYTINWLKSSSAQEKLGQLIDERQYDLIHFDTISLAPYHTQRISCPTVMDHHNVESHMLVRRAENERNPLKKLYFAQEGLRLKRFEKKNLGTYTAHIVCSEDDKERLLGIDSSLSVTVIPNGISVSSEHPSRAPSRPQKLLFVGGLDWYPNKDAVEFFIAKVWPLVLAQNPDLEFHVIGKNPSASITSMANSSRNVHVHGFVDSIESFYRTATLYVCPIRDGGGTKLKVLDAMANAVPVLAHPVACEGIDVTAGKNVIFAETPQQFAEAILANVEQHEVLRRIGENGYKLIREQYDFMQIGQNLAYLFSRLASNQARGRR